MQLKRRAVAGPPFARPHAESANTGKTSMQFLVHFQCGTHTRLMEYDTLDKATADVANMAHAILTADNVDKWSVTFARSNNEPKDDVIVLRFMGNMWHATFKGPHRVDIIAAMGADTIVTPFGNGQRQAAFDQMRRGFPNAEIRYAI